MSETIIISLVAVVMSFLCGLFVGLYTSGKRRLVEDSGVCDGITESIEGSKDTAGDVADRLGDLIEAGSDIEDIFSKYRESAPEDKKLE